MCVTNVFLLLVLLWLLVSSFAKSVTGVRSFFLADNSCLLCLSHSYSLTHLDTISDIEEEKTFQKQNLDEQSN